MFFITFVSEYLYKVSNQRHSTRASDKEDYYINKNITEY